MVDACRNAIIDENLEESNLNTEACKVSGELPRDDFLLDVITPLEVGGRSHPNIGYPADINDQNFTGCVKNIRVNGQVGRSKSSKLTILITVTIIFHFQWFYIIIIIIVGFFKVVRSTYWRS